MRRESCPNPSGRRIGEKGGIAAEDLVTAVAAQRHLDGSSGGPGERILRQERGVGQRLVQKTPDPLHQGQRLGRPEHDLVMLRTEARGDNLREAPLVVARYVEADREALERERVRV